MSLYKSKVLRGLVCGCDTRHDSYYVTAFKADYSLWGILGKAAAFELISCPPWVTAFL